MYEVYKKKFNYSNSWLKLYERSGVVKISNQHVRMYWFFKVFFIKDKEKNHFFVKVNMLCIVSNKQHLRSKCPLLSEDKNKLIIHLMRLTLEGDINMHMNLSHRKEEKKKTKLLVILKDYDRIQIFFDIIDIFYND